MPRKGQTVSGRLASSAKRARRSSSRAASPLLLAAASSEHQASSFLVGVPERAGPGRRLVSLARAVPATAGRRGYQSAIEAEQMGRLGWTPERLSPRSLEWRSRVALETIDTAERRPIPRQGRIRRCRVRHVSIVPGSGDELPASRSTACWAASITRSPRHDGRGPPHLQRLHRHDHLASRRGLTVALRPTLAARDSSAASASSLESGLQAESCPPSSGVGRDGHPSERPTRGLSEQPAAARSRLRPPIRSCSGSSLPRFTPASLRASSLWRWSSPHGGRALPASLLYGARTFLERGLSTIAPAAVRPPPGRRF